MAWTRRLELPSPGKLTLESLPNVLGMVGVIMGKNIDNTADAADFNVDQMNC